MISLNPWKSNIFLAVALYSNNETLYSNNDLSFTQECKLKPDKPEKMQKVTMYWHGFLPADAEGEVAIHIAAFYHRKGEQLSQDMGHLACYLI